MCPFFHTWWIIRRVVHGTRDYHVSLNVIRYTHRGTERSEICVLRTWNGVLCMDSARWRNFPTEWPLARMPPNSIISRTLPVNTFPFWRWENNDSPISHCCFLTSCFCNAVYLFPSFLHHQFHGWQSKIFPCSILNESWEIQQFPCLYDHGHHLPSFCRSGFLPCAINKFLQIFLMDSHKASQFKRFDLFLAYPFSQGAWFDMEDLRCLFDSIYRFEHVFTNLQTVIHPSPVIIVLPWSKDGRWSKYWNYSVRLSFPSPIYMAFYCTYMFVYVKKCKKMKLYGKDFPQITYCSLPPPAKESMRNCSGGRFFYH